MYLKRLDLVGFKTFADKSDLEFGKGITAIVGPNGSGKSNIADSILWVLGERSMKTLRGAKPVDVIFSGNHQRKPVNIADVSLTFNNTDHWLPLDFSEVTITRRVDRSGESEYLINKTPCRLKDITELFLDTGVGRAAYTVVTQSEIDALLSIKPEDRRAMFDEVAGIQKYHVRRKEAKSKLEKTELNLVRIADIIYEIESQLGPLAEQAEIAREYEHYQNRLKELQLALMAREYDNRLRHRERLLLQREEGQNRISQLSARIAQSESEEQILNLKLTEMEKSIAEIQQTTTQLITQVSVTEGKIAVVRERIRALKEQNQTAEQEILALSARSAATVDQQAYAKTEQIRMTEALEGLRAQLEEHEVDLQQVIASVNKLEQALEQKKVEYFDLVRTQMVKRNAISSAETTLSSLLSRRQSLEAALSKLELNLNQAQADYATVTEALENERSQIQTLQTRAQTIAEALSNRKQQLESKLMEQQSLRETISNKGSRLQTLLEMEASMEGFFHGVKSVVMANREGRLPGFYGVVADLITVPEQYQTAVEAALGNQLQNIVTENEDEAAAAIEHLKANRAGRATFLPLNLLRPPNLDHLRQLAGSQGLLGIAADLVEFDARYSKVVQYLMGRILVVDHLKNALTLAHQLDRQVRLVTLEGELIVPGGAITGGNMSQRESMLLTRKREIDHLKKELDQLKPRQEANVQLIEELERMGTADSDEWETLKQRTAEAFAELARKEQRATHLQQEVTRLRTEQEQTQLDQTEINAEQQAQSELRSREQEALVQQEELIQQAEEEMASLQDHLEQAKSRREISASATSELRVEQASLNERLAAASATLLALVQSERENEYAIRQKREMIAQAQTEIETLNDQNTKNEEGVVSLIQQKQEQESAFARWREDRQQVLNDLEQANALMRTHRTDLHLAEDEAHKIELRETQVGTELTEMERRFQEDYHVSPEEALPSKDKISSVQTASEEVVQLRTQIEAMGVVNLGAIAEHQRLTERVTFLQTQQTDLEKAKADLEQVIKEIDEKTRTQFMETFEAVGREFDVLFKRIFNGGNTRLTLSDPTNLLDTGVEVRVQPPGKAEQDLLLLSGGERALTALALMLAMMRIKPSPFCVLDEVDAPLDESNVDRFAELIKEFSEQTQFIIITHNKGTMEAANALYGVTMQDNGVSKLVSVKFEEAAEMVGT